MRLILELISLLSKWALHGADLSSATLFIFEGLARQDMTPRSVGMENFEPPAHKEAQPDNEGVSRLLRAWSDGDQSALDRLTSLVYDELRGLAKRYMRGECPAHSLQTTALVNEAYMRLVDYKSMQWQNRAHFFSVLSQLMRRILVDHARCTI